MKRLFPILLLLLTAPAQAANEIRVFTPDITTSAYAMVREVDGDVWHVVDELFEVYGTDANVYVDTIVSAEDGFLSFSISDTGNDRRCVAEFQTKGLKRLVGIATTLQGSSTLYAEGRLWQ